LDIPKHHDADRMARSERKDLIAGIEYFHLFAVPHRQSGISRQHQSVRVQYPYFCRHSGSSLPLQTRFPKAVSFFHFSLPGPSSQNITDTAFTLVAA
jgi:hypothetical protein